MRIALAQYDFPVGDITGNVRRIQTLIEQARDAHGADLAGLGRWTRHPVA